MILDATARRSRLSTPVDTVWADPRKLAEVPQDFPRSRRRSTATRSGWRAA